MSQGKPRKFTSEELKQFDGINGQPLYIVFKGKVYDLTSSKLWPQGKHMGMHVRSDNLTEAIKSAPHGEDNIYRFPLVGELEEAVLQVPVTPSVEEKVIKPQVQPPIQPSSAEMERRQFLKLVAAAGGAVIIIVLLSIFKAGILVPPTTAVSAGSIATFTKLTPRISYYFLTDTSNYCVKLGMCTTGIIGPNKETAAFRAVCQHLGCECGFVPPSSSPLCSLYLVTQDIVMG
jgi:predicted heme/steroid binding protein